jgi:hypothetical protein
MNMNFLVRALVLRIFSLKCGFFKCTETLLHLENFKYGAQLFVSSIYQKNELIFENGINLRPEVRSSKQPLEKNLT